jgi:hypothetical protein
MNTTALRNENSYLLENENSYLLGNNDTSSISYVKCTRRNNCSTWSESAYCSCSIGIIFIFLILASCIYNEYRPTGIMPGNQFNHTQYNNDKIFDDDYFYNALDNNVNSVVNYPSVLSNDLLMQHVASNTELHNDITNGFGESMNYIFRNYTWESLHVRGYIDDINRKYIYIRDIHIYLKDIWEIVG